MASTTNTCTTIGFPLSHFNYDGRSWGFFHDANPLNLLPQEVYERVARHLDARSFCRLSRTCRELSRRELPTFDRVRELFSSACHIVYTLPGGFDNAREDSFNRFFGLPQSKRGLSQPTYMYACGSGGPPPPPDWKKYLEAIREADTMSKKIEKAVKPLSSELKRAGEEVLMRMRQALNQPPQDLHPQIFALMQQPIHVLPHNFMQHIQPMHLAQLLQPPQSTLGNLVDKATSAVKGLFNSLFKK